MSRCACCRRGGVWSRLLCAFYRILLKRVTRRAQSSVPPPPVGTRAGSGRDNVRCQCGVTAFVKRCCCCKCQAFRKCLGGRLSDRVRAVATGVVPDRCRCNPERRSQTAVKIKGEKVLTRGIVTHYIENGTIELSCAILCPVVAQLGDGKKDKVLSRSLCLQGQFVALNNFFKVEARF